MIAIAKLEEGYEVSDGCSERVRLVVCGEHP